MMAWLTHDWKNKVIALFLAIGLWYYALSEESIEVKRAIPLDIRVQNAQMSVLKTSVRYVWVTFNVPRNVLSELTAKEIRAVHDIGAEVRSAGEYSFRLEAHEIKVGNPQIRIAKVVPETIHVTLDELIVQKVQIKPKFVGEPAFGYKVDENEMTIDPNAILLEGPKGQLEKLEAVYTEEIDLVGRIRPFRRTVKLSLPSNVKSQADAVVDVFVPLKEEFGEKSFTNLPLKILSSSEEFARVEIDPKTISFTLKGSRQRLEKLTPESLMPYVEVSVMKPGDYQSPVKIVLPEDVSLKEDLTVHLKILEKK